jgi:CDP-glycerol glycerophosphotransferase
VPLSEAELASPGVTDVTRYPDVSHLYVAADVLITDYSSSMFDFALTGKPMLFFAYDLDVFRDSIRGFYFDFLPEVPGPVVTTQDELVTALHRMNDDRATYAARYDAFRRTYCSLEDGHATDRVIELFSPRLPSRA